MANWTEKHVNGVQNFQNKAGEFFDKIQQNKKEEYISNKTALVDGVYMRNHAARNQTLKHIWAKYNMLPDIVTQSLGKLYDVISESYMSPKNMKSLLDFTHDGSSVVSSMIKEKYLTVGNENKVRDIAPVTKDYFNAWARNDDYKNKSYLTYWEELESKKKLIPVNKNIAVQTFSIETYSENDKLNNTIGKENRSNIQKKTADIFKNRTILKTIVNSFFDGKNNGKGSSDDALELIDTAKTKYGHSRGRNLLKRGNSTEEINGYTNPYCRVWTQHHQYDNVNELIRNKENIGHINGVDELALEISKYQPQRHLHLINKSVLAENGFVRINPDTIKDNDYSSYYNQVKKCMFSIENLAWKDKYKQNNESVGKIMWFPPYNLKFTDNANVEWNKNVFIGRGEPIYTYSNTTRTGTLSFTMLVDHPSIVNSMQDGECKYGDEDYENEILRFFAGCIDGKLNNKALLKTYNEESADEYIQKIDNILTTNEEGGNSTQFSVYFPNNYSGKDDERWAEYLMYGYLASYGEKDEDYEITRPRTNGYETHGEYSLSDIVGITNVSSFDEEEHKENEISTYGIEHGCTKDKNTHLLYKVDKDKNPQCLSNKDNYKDKDNFRLNATPNKSGDKENDVEYLSFEEVYDILNDVVKANDTYDKGQCEFYDVYNENEKINRVKITGYASSHDNNNANEMAKRRCYSVKKWLNKKLNIDDKAFVIKTDVENVSGSDINTEEAKKARRVDVVIFYNASTIEERIAKADETQQERLDELKTERVNKIGKVGYNPINEASYFKNIAEKDPMKFELIKKKIKFFNPAFHSISPEGFNMRLNFLHQCTRQGPTLEKAGTENSENLTPYNLAFGRPPVCVLKIGDFIHTKMIINTLTITYESGNGMQWDLNPEGIGIQPMFANVNMGIELLGGQSIEKPISMLNNAASFNFYANTEVYNNEKYN